VQTKLFTILLICFAAAALSEDFKTVNGKEYKGATVTRTEPDGIVVKTNSGITKVYFTELPKDVQEHFHYDAAQAASYSAEQTANYSAYQKQQEETRRKQEDGEAKHDAALAEQQAATSRTQTLQRRYGELQKQEDDLLRQIGQAKQSGPEYHQGKSVRHKPNPKKSELPLFQSHLSEVRHEKAEIRKQLEKAHR
jgi:hypothetical protein